MKSLLSISFATLFSLSVSSQTYISASYNISAGNSIELGSYPSVEVGQSIGNSSLGFCVGRGNLDFSSKETIRNWYAELRAQYNIKFEEKYFLYLGAGLGQYVDTPHTITEFDLGLIRKFKSIDIFGGLARFDEVNYIQIGLSTFLVP